MMGIGLKRGNLKTAVYWWSPTRLQLPKLGLRVIRFVTAGSSVIVPPRMNMFLARTVLLTSPG
jgi:hypothetical protein